MKKGFATLYDRCSEAVKTRLKTVDGCDRIDCDQSVHDLVKVIQKICVGHDDTNQDMYNVVQACKNMFLSRQSDETLTEDYLRDFKSYWDTCEAYKFRAGTHKIEVSNINIFLHYTQPSMQKTDTCKKNEYNYVYAHVKVQNLDYFWVLTVVL